MVWQQKKWLFISMLLSMSMAIFSCGKPTPDNTPDPLPDPLKPAFDINSITDNYEHLSAAGNYLRWGPYNVHDPSILKDGDTYYCYNTDVAFGTDIKPGIQIRYSKDLVGWKFYGWVFDQLPEKGAEYIRQNGTQPFNSLWAPYILKHGDEYRLYYSLSSPDPRRSVIGLAVASHPTGPWTERGIVVTSANDSKRQTNAIDPTVITTPGGEQYFYYGSGWDGIYVLQLNPETGLAKNPGNIGTRIANRGFTGGQYNGNIEAPEIIYNPEQQKYYLFIAYDWIDTKYNVRVGRGDTPTGPFYDINGVDLNEDIDHLPMILAPYQFSGHSGWQGVSHCAVFDDGSGQYYIAHQGRPGFQKFFMILHVRKLFWTEDGWPLVSPERYAWEDISTVAENELLGKWEQIAFSYTVVPGYSEEQIDPDFQKSVEIEINADGSLSSSPYSKWVYKAPWLTFSKTNGEEVKVFVQAGRDWENKKETVIFSGLMPDGYPLWGKKVE